MGKKIGFAGCIALLVAVVALALPAAGFAGCTASITCSNACHEVLECASGVVISCSAVGQALSCTGTSSCIPGTNSVTCDGVTTNCSTSWCAKDAVSIRCASQFKACPTCGGRVCQTSPAPDFLKDPAPAAGQSASCR